MEIKKSSELDEESLNIVTGGLSFAFAQESRNLDNERALVMNDLLQGLSFGPVAPECTDIRR